VLLNIRWQVQPLGIAGIVMRNPVEAAATVINGRGTTTLPPVLAGLPYKENSCHNSLICSGLKLSRRNQTTVRKVNAWLFAAKPCLAGRTVDPRRTARTVPRLPRFQKQAAPRQHQAIPRGIIRSKKVGRIQDRGAMFLRCNGGFVPTWPGGQNSDVPDVEVRRLMVEPGCRNLI
jgi:hypothetical protein